MDWNWSSVVLVVLAPLAGGVVGFGVWFLQSRIDKIQHARERLQDERRKVYTDVLDPFIRIFTGIKKPQETQKAMKQIVSYAYKKAAIEFNIIGADNVVKAFNELMQYIYETEEDESGNPVETMLRWGRVLLAMRKSVGDPATKLTEIDMLQSQIKGLNAWIQQGEKPKPQDVQKPD